MRLIITRHGETEENKERVLMGQLQGKLTPLGIEQAKKLALRLKYIKIDIIYSSDLARAKDTAQEIIRYHPDTPFKVVKELRERNLGEFQGRKKSDFDWKPGEFKATSIVSKEGETVDALCKRAKKFLKDILSKHLHDTMLLVAHNGINKALICMLMNKKPYQIEEIENQKNTSVCIFDIEKIGKYKIIEYNSIDHLQ